MNDNRSFDEMMQDASPEARALALKLIGNITEDEMVIAKVIANLTVDACNGDKHESRILMQDLAQKFPAIARLFAKVGYQLNQSRGATKQ